MSENALDEKCRAKEREWREALLEKRDALLADRERLTKLCEDLTAGKEHALQDARQVRDQNARVLRQRDALALELRRARSVVQKIAGEKERLLRHIERCECELKTEAEAHRREKENFQEISRALTKEVESLHAAHSFTVQEIRKENDWKIIELSKEKAKMESGLNDSINQIKHKSKELSEENKKCLLQINEMQEELNMLRGEQFSLNATIERQGKVIRDAHQKSDSEIIVINQKLQSALTENKSIKEENYDFRSKIQHVEQKLQNLVSENLNLKCIQTDNSYKKEITDKKFEDMNFEHQKLVAELECIKSHPILVEMNQIKQQNDVLRNVILEQKQNILKLSSEKELENQRTMVTSETQTVNRTSEQIKEVKKHSCIQRNIDAVKSTKTENNDTHKLKADEKRMQDLENIVFILKHTLIEKVKSDFIGE